MQIIGEVLASLFLILGGIFALVGSIGLIKLRDTMQRLHAPTKAATLGVAGVLIASVIYFPLVIGKITFHEILIALFILLTAPITANFIAKVFLLENKRKSDLPDTTTEHGWTIYDAPPEQPDGRG
jgi:multicomponent K+:H+ antiporter subunit G